MKKITFNKKLFWFILAAVLALIGLIFWFYYTHQLSSKLPSSSYFQINDDPKNVIHSQKIAELSVTPQAVEVWEKKLSELETQVINIQDELKRKKYYNDIAMYLAYLGRYDEAYDYYIKSLDISYIDRITWLQLGDLLIRMNAYKSAEVAYTRGNDINPYEPLNYIKLADLYVLMGKSEVEVVAVYDQGISKIEKSTSILQAKAYYYEKNKNYKAALVVYEELLKIADQDSRANIQEAISHVKDKIQ